MANKFWKVGGCHVEELALPTRAIQLSDKVLSTNEAVHWAHNSCRLLKAVTTTPCICLELEALDRSEINICKAYTWVWLHCGSPAEPRLLPTVVLQVVVVVRTGSPRTRTAHNTLAGEFWQEVDLKCSTELVWTVACTILTAFLFSLDLLPSFGPFVLEFWLALSSESGSASEEEVSEGGGLLFCTWWVDLPGPSLLLSPLCFPLPGMSLHTNTQIPW